MTLLIDAGNSSIKWSLLDDAGLLTKQQSIFYSENSNSPSKAFQSIISENIDLCTLVVLVSVLGDEFSNEAIKNTEDLSLEFKQIKSSDKLAGIKNAYIDPCKLGADRFVAMISAFHLINDHNQQQKACIVVDVGTATTIDAIDETGQHIGGLILPGIDLCSRSLLENTELLPLWSKKGNNEETETTFSLFAKETTEAISSASVFGLSGAIDSICKKMEKEILKNNSQINPETTVERIICGGGVKQLLPYFENNYQYEENLLMKGLKTILEVEQS